MSRFHSPTRRQVCRGLALAGAALILPSAARAVAVIPGATADRIVVLKSERKLTLWRDGRLIATYPVALGGNPVGPKRRQGDKRTPEGRYSIDGMNPRSRYYRALHISYPNAEDVRLARVAGLAPGSDVEIHGLSRGFEDYDPAAFTYDWTDGCIAVSNRAIDEIWDRVRVATVIDILP